MDGNKSDFSWIKTLGHASGALRQIVPFSAGRARLVDLFGGTRNEEWFLLQVRDVFDMLLQYRAGILFVRRITEKLQVPCREWLAELTQPATVEIMCKQESGTMFVEYLFDKCHERMGILSGVQQCLETNQMAEFQELVRSLMRKTVGTPEFRFFDELWRFDYVNRPELCGYLAELVKIEAHERWDPLVVPFVQNPASFAGDEHQCEVLEALLGRGTREQREAIRASVVTNVALFVEKPHSSKVLCACLPVLNKHTVIKVAEKITMLMERQDSLPQHYADLLVVLAWTIPADERRTLLNSQQRKIMELQSDDIAEAYAYLEYLENH